MSLILRFVTDLMNTIDGTDTRDEMNIPDQQNTSVIHMASPTTLDIRVDPLGRTMGIVEQIMDLEQEADQEEQESDQRRITAQATRIVADTLQRILEDMLPWLGDSSANEVTLLDQLKNGGSRERESFRRTYQRYLRLRNKITTLETELRINGSLWMAALQLDRSESPHGSLEIIEELNSLRELRVIQRVEVMQQAKRWAQTRNNATTPGVL